MNHSLRKIFLVLGLGLVLTTATAGLDKDKYHSPQEVLSLLKSWNAQYPQLTKVIPIGKSVEGQDLAVLRIAHVPDPGQDSDKRPAVFIAANLEGVHLPGTEAALQIAEKLLTQYGSEEQITQLLDTRTVYVAPLLNPDVAQLCFAGVRHERRTNALPMDEDMDALVDEDGPDDLNGDGLITQMRVKDPEGTWIPDPQEPRLLRRADSKKGEKGLYKVYTEGLDNDGDGAYNEDPPGGIELNRNYPHDFEYNLKPAGLWPVSAQENVALMDFLINHKNIALVLSFSTENTILNLNQTGRAQAAGGKVKVPRRFATFLGIDPEREFEMQELVNLLKGMNIFGGREIDESMVAMMLGLGPAMTLDRQDRPYIEAVQKDYKEAMKKAKIEYPERRAKGVGKGSFAAYCYFQYGTQVFSTDLWAVPEPKKEKRGEEEGLTAERLKTMTADEFLALGEDKIAAFLKEQGAPPNIQAPMLINMVKSGRMTPDRMAQMMERMPRREGADEEAHPDVYLLEWSDTALEGKGFVDWTPFKHPTLGEVEIGGFIPYLQTIPPVSELSQTVDFHTDFYIELITRLPVLGIKATEVEELGEGLYQVKVYLTNTGWFPTSTAQGRKAGTAWPIRIELKTSKGQTIFSGNPILTVSKLDGSGDTQAVEWTVRGKRGSTVRVKASSPKLDTVQTTITLQSNGGET